jgi:hypothetical protein
MGILTKDALLGASDLVEREVELPSIGGSVVVRSLPAAYSNQAMSDSLEVTTTTHRGRNEQIARVNTVKLEALQVLHALVKPKLASIEEAYVFSQQCGPAWRRVVEVIDEISGIDKATIEKTNATFQSGGPGETGTDLGNGTRAGDGRPDLPVRAGVGAEDVGGGTG